MAEGGYALPAQRHQQRVDRPRADCDGRATECPARAAWDARTRLTPSTSSSSSATVDIAPESPKTSRLIAGARAFSRLVTRA